MMTRRAFLCIALVLPALAAMAQERLVQRIVLREGILVHPTEGVAYTMVPGEGIAALDLTTGVPLWTTTAASKPLLLIGDRLLAQIQPATIPQRDDLLLAALDVGKRGALIARAGRDLPDEVFTTVTATPHGRFFVVARHEGSDTARVEWVFVPSPRRRMPSLPSSGEPPPIERLREILGVLRVNLATVAIGDATSEVELLPANRPEDPLVRGSDTDDEPGTTYRSADGRNLLTSRRMADDRTWENYLWTITDAASGEKRGEIRTFVAFAPFVVRAGMLVFETTPYARRGEIQPAKLRGYDLATGREKWNFEIREVVFRGSMPP